jgi:hypothetical protein
MEGGIDYGEERAFVKERAQDRNVRLDRATTTTIYIFRRFVDEL